LLRGRASETAAAQGAGFQRQRRSNYFKAATFMFAVLAGFVVVVVSADIAMNFLGVRRIHTASLLLSNTIKKVDVTRDQIVLIGSSQTAQGINGVLLEDLLHRSGLNLQVIQLSVPAVFNVESDLLLEQYLAKAPRKPIGVFIDTGFDSQPLPIIGLRRGALEIAASGLSATWQRTKISSLRNWEAINGAGLNQPALIMNRTMELVSELGDIASFFLCNISSCGILRQIDPEAPGQYSVATETLTGHAKDFVPDMMIGPAGMACGATRNDLTAEVMEPSLSFRGWQKEKYLDRGIRMVAFFYPPNQSARTACFPQQFCNYFGDKTCLTLGRAILTDLNSFDYWYDPHHVNNVGVPILTAAIARDIENLFALDRNEPPAK
jgi:hypothetical protein